MQAPLRNLTNFPSWHIWFCRRIIAEIHTCTDFRECSAHRQFAEPTMEIPKLRYSGWFWGWFFWDLAGIREGGIVGRQADKLHPYAAPLVTGYHPSAQSVNLVYFSWPISFFNVPPFFSFLFCLKKWSLISKAQRWIWKAFFHLWCILSKLSIRLIRTPFITLIHVSQVAVLLW